MNKFDEIERLKRQLDNLVDLLDRERRARDEARELAVKKDKELKCALVQLTIAQQDAKHYRLQFDRKQLAYDDLRREYAIQGRDLHLELDIATGNAEKMQKQLAEIKALCP